jgi:pentatricopeptide repeat protein
LNIKPNNITYTQYLTACSKAKDAKKAEEIFKEAKNTPGNCKGLKNLT